MQDLWYIIRRPNPQIMNMKEEEEIQTKIKKGIFNKIKAENFPNLVKERVIQVQEAFRIPKGQDQNVIPIYIMLKTLNIQNKGRILKATIGN
jgi:hypothetical protein